MPGFWLQCLCSKFWIYWVGVSTKFTTWQIQNLQHDNRLCCSFFFLINHSSFLPALRETEDLEQVAQYGSKCINTNCGHKNIYESTSDNTRQIRHYRIGTRFKCPSIWLLLRNFLRGIFFLMLDCLLNWFKVKWRQLLP